MTAAGTVGAQLTAFLALPVLSRMYSPAEFGVWALFMSAAFAVPVLAGLRYEIAIVLARTDQGAARLLQSVFIIGLVFSVLWIFLIFALTALGQRSGAFQVSPAYYLIAPMILANAVFQSSLMWWTRGQLFGRIALMRTLLSAGVVFTQLVLGLTTNLGGLSLIFGTVLGQLFAAVVVYGVIEKEDRLFRSAHWRALHFRAVLCRYRRMPLYAAPYSLQGQGFTQAVVAVLGNFGSASLAGQYALGQRIVYYPMTVISSSLGQAILPRLVSARANLPQFLPFFHGMIRVFLLLLIPIYALLLSYGGIIAQFVLGPKWAPAGEVMAWLFLPSMLLVTGSWFERIFDVLDRQHIQLALELTSNILIMIALLSAVYFLPAIYGVLITSLGLALYYVVWLFVAFHTAGFPLFGLIRSLLLGLLLFAASIIILNAARYFNAPQWAWFGVMFGSFLYYIFVVRYAFLVLNRAKNFF